MTQRKQWDPDLAELLTILSTKISDATAVGRALLTAVDAGAQRSALGLGTAATAATGDFDAAGAATAAQAGAIAASQPLDADLTWLAANLSTFARTLLDDTSAAAMLATIGGTNLTNLLAALGMTTTDVDGIPRWVREESNNLASGTARMVEFTPLVDILITKLACTSGTVVSSGLTLARMALCTVSGSTLTAVARTASDTTLLNGSQTLYQKALDTGGGYPASYQLVAGTRYAMGVLAVGTTAGSLTSIVTVGATIGQTPRIASAKAGLADLDGAMAGWTASGITPHMRASA